MATIFITGGAGFIGSNFVRYWAAQHPDDSIINYDLLTYAGNLENVVDVERDHAERYTFIKGDIRDHDALMRIFSERRPDIIVNFAAESHNSLAVLEPKRFFETNVIGTHELLRAARDANVPRLHHISTCEVYGDLPLDTDERFTESSPYRPRTPYNASKAAADMAVRAYVETFGLPATISNCGNNYGPYQYPEKIIPHFATRLLQGQKMPLYQSSKNRREWIHVDDHCRAIDRILEDGKIGETYNIGTGHEVDIETIADTLLDIFNLDASYKQYVPDRPGHDRRYLLDSSKIQNELGWKPTVSFNEGFRATVAWYQKNNAWWKPLLARNTINESRWKSVASDAQPV